MGKYGISLIFYLLISLYESIPLCTELLNEENDGIISLKLLLSKDNQYQFEVITIGQTQEFRNFNYDTQNEDSYVGLQSCLKCFTSYDPTKSQTFINYKDKVSIYYPGFDFHAFGQYGNDYFTVDFNEKRFNTTFLLAESLDTEIAIHTDGVIGLGYKYDNHKFGINSSFIDQLMNANTIKNKIIVQEIDGNYGKLFIGGVPLRISETFKDKFSTCNIPQGAYKWSCEVSNVVAGNSVNIDNSLRYSDNKSIAIFSTLENYIIAPENAWNYFNITYFNEENCENLTISKNLFTFKCNLSLNFSKDVYVLLDNVAYNIQFIDLFTKNDDNSYVFNIRFQKNLNSDQWIMGQIFLKNFPVVFDATKNTVGFYGGNKIYFSVSSSKLWINLSIVISVFVIVLFVFCIIRYFRKRRSESQFIFQGDQVFLRTSSIKKETL